MNKTQKFNGTVIPMFLPNTMEQPMASKAQTQTMQQRQQAELSVFDVKELYDLAYAYEHTDEGKFKALLSEAVKLDMDYRRQLNAKMSYKDISKEKAFQNACDIQNMARSA